MLRRAIVLALCFFTAFEGVASNGRPSDGQILEEALVRGQAFENLQHVTDTIGARLTGSQNLEQAAAFAIERFKAYGLSNVHREEWLVPSTWERGRCSVTVVDPIARPLIAASMGWNLPTPNAGVTGEIINIKAGTEKQLAEIG